MSSADFYDDFLSSQIESGINDRIYSLYKKICRKGLRRDEHILEIGCGIGALTFLLAKKIGRGVIEALDPSPKSIAFARDKIQRPNVHFATGDILHFQPGYASTFDKVILFDVLEHIPEEDHLAVFKKIEAFLKQDGLLLINLPNPKYILYDRANQPDILQELDQPVFLHELLPKIIQANLELVSFETHSVWVKEDYHFLTVRKQREFAEELLSASRGLLQKGLLKLERSLRKLKHRFP